jgi:hypothetical protein
MTLRKRVQGASRNRIGMITSTVFAVSMAARSLSEPFPAQFLRVDDAHRIFLQTDEDFKALVFWDQILTCDDGGRGFPRA